MPELTDKVSDVTDALIDLLKGNWEKYADTKDDIYYGEQSKFPRYPAITVESAPQNRELQQTGLQQRISYTFYITVYHGLIKSVEGNKRGADLASEAIVDQLHSNRKLNGLVIHGSVTSNEPGFATRGGALVAANRITWTGISNYTMPKD